MNTVRCTLINLGNSAPLAMSLTYISAAQSMGIMMNNAVSNEHFSQIISTASTSQCNALILASPDSKQGK